MTAVQVPLSRGHVAVIDAADAELVMQHKWSAMPRRHTVYAFRTLRFGHGSRTTVALHRFLTGFAITDHINGDGLDNRRSNLREASAADNTRNQRLTTRNRSGFKGVSWVKSERLWQAHIGQNGQRLFLGRHATAELAAVAYDTAARSLHGDFATLNFPLSTERAA